MTGQSSCPKTHLTLLLLHAWKVFINRDSRKDLKEPIRPKPTRTAHFIPPESNFELLEDRSAVITIGSHGRIAKEEECMKHTYCRARTGTYWKNWQYKVDLERAPIWGCCTKKLDKTCTANRGKLLLLLLPFYLPAYLELVWLSSCLSLGSFNSLLRHVLPGVDKRSLANVYETRDNKTFRPHSYDLILAEGKPHWVQAISKTGISNLDDMQRLSVELGALWQHNQRYGVDYTRLFAAVDFLDIKLFNIDSLGP
ncbi:hypothetical protein K435DRAFT_937874 [Dendrothele bispora CBS 962.96]|uniref:Uncharacterized protein n=1 Tax=Dendrothele bispora (strain CBS 962.96) TaxID=1314807 RepID=A0A4S8KYJ5_DENBC|nr:hypothetical protein K435DRAFT_937874 [Dendrothele bispora CBS 962.96]